MRVISLFLFVFCISNGYSQENYKGEDHPLISRMPGFYIYDYRKTNYGSMKVAIKGEKPKTVEGKNYIITYVLKEGAENPGKLGIVRNYERAIEQKGGEVKFHEVFERYSAGRSTLKFEKDSKQIWISIATDHYGKKYTLNIIEKATLEQQVTVNAEYLWNALLENGKVAVYDILFDTNLSSIKPESDEVLSQLAALLKEQPGLKLYVVGHTDMTGGEQDNLKLSENRAQAVVDWVAANHQIQTNRLVPKGVGALCPVASNNSEEGKQKNRRVEFVKIIK